MTSLAVEALTSKQLLELFRTLPCPEHDELDGEYTSRLLRQPNWLYAIGAAVTVQTRYVNWQAKGFRRTGEGQGRGYNRFRVFGRRRQCWPMATSIAPSRYDGKPVFQLDYRKYRSMCGAINMVDEVRRLEDGRYLGIGTLGFTKRMRMIPLPFLLEGPVAGYLGDHGKPR
jgi:hypothetical protein